jgi:hypothetical protein
VRLAICRNLLKTLSGREDSNLRPLRPKADGKKLQKQPVFKYLAIKALVAACGTLLKLEAPDSYKI